MQTRTKKIIFISILIILIICMTIGYAVLSNKLTIGGTASIPGGNLEVIFLKNYAKIKSEGFAICEIGTIEDTTIKDLSVILKEDGDSCTFTIPVENLGNMTAYLTDVVGKDNSLTFDGLENNIEKIRPYVNYEVKYGEMQINSQTQFDKIAPLEAKEKEIVTLKATLNEGVDMEKMDPVTLGGFDRTFIYNIAPATGNSPLPPTQITTPNNPILNGDMIPVYYDNGWKKADITNMNNNWYNYTNQKWANAVTINNSVIYKEKELEVVPLNLKNELKPAVYQSTNQKQNSSESNLTLNFTTGSSSGVLSFDYEVSSEEDYDELVIKVTIGDVTKTIANYLSGEYSRHYEEEIPANTSVKIVADYSKDGSSNDGTDTATISNLTLPSDLSQELTINSIGDYPWEKKESKPREGYKSTNQYVDSEEDDEENISYESKSNLTMNFKTGASGTLSFDYEVSSEEDYDKLTIKVTIGDQTETIANEISGEILDHYKKEIPANTKVTIVADYTKDTSSESNDDTGYLYNIVLPDNLSEELTINSTGDYPWEKFKYDGEMRYYVATSYEFNERTGKYTLEDFDNHKFTNDDIGKYVCLNGSNSCDGNEIYKIKTIEDNTITSVIKYIAEEDDNIRNKYKNATMGTPIVMSDINTMWVWIPRYAYHISGTYGKGGLDSNLPGEIETKFISSTAQADENWIVPSAFNFDGNKDGFWIAKFEVTGSLKSACVDENCDISTVTILPGNASLRSQKTSSYFYMAKAMQKNTDIYGFASSGDLHMIKNDEWGAVAYLSQSRYGKYGNSDYTGSYEEIYQNKSSSYKTGSSNGTPSQSTSRSTQYTYNSMTKLGKGQGQAGPGASTTGTIYGVYDMNGGAYEKVMAVLDYNDNPMSGRTTSYNSGFTGVIYDSKKYTDYTTNIAFPDKKYYNEYKFSSLPESKDFDSTLTACNSNICYGQALSETKNWYNDNAEFAYNQYPWLVRGGRYSSKEESGIFAITSDDGSSNSYYSTRFVLVP